jgi:hypothetical protein
MAEYTLVITNSDGTQRPVASWPNVVGYGMSTGPFGALKQHNTLEAPKGPLPPELAGVEMDDVDVVLFSLFLGSADDVESA